MNAYILHVSTLTNSGELCSDCSNLYVSLHDAQEVQDMEINDWRKEHNEDLIEEKIGFFRRLAVRDNIAEIQTCIKTIDLSKYIKEL